MSNESTQTVITKYLNSGHSDLNMLAEDVTFTVMATGQESRGREAVSGLLNYFYHVAFDANADTRTLIFGEKSALWEGTFFGKHVGEFAGVPATNKDVRVPINVVYDVENGQIKSARIYFEMPVLFQQLGVN